MAKFLWALLVLVYSAKFSISTPQPAKRSYDTHNYYVIERKAGSPASLGDISQALGVEVVEQAGQLHDTWLVRTRKPELVVRDADPGSFDPVLTAFESLRLTASSPIVARTDEGFEAKNIVSSVNFLELQTPKELVKRAPIPTRTITAEVVKEKMGLHDPLFTEQWHHVNDDYPGNDMNVTGVWDMGLTGKGVIASFLDDGIDFEVDDLKDAFVQFPPFSLFWTFVTFVFYQGTGIISRF
jgi:kexin